MESYVETNQLLVNKTASQLSKSFPIETPSKVMSIVGPITADVNKDIYTDIPAQKDTKIKRKSWTIPLKAKVRVTDKKTGSVLSEKLVKLVDVPLMTNRYSFIIDGNEYSSMYQWRLKPGIYTRYTKDGFFESTFNLALAKLTLRLDPESLLFYLTVGTTSEKFYLYPILRTYGILEKEMQDAWGTTILNKNRATGLTYESQTLTGLAKKLIKKDPNRTSEITIQEARELILKYFEGTQLDAKVVNITVGVDSDKINPEVLLATSKKLLKVMRGEAKEDERDSLAFKDLYDVGDRVEYYLERNLRNARKKIEFKLRNKSDVTDILSNDVLPKVYKNAFLKDDLISPNPQTNPMEMLLEARKTTVMGPGGIQSSHAITEDVRNIHPSHIGILDPLQTPEGQKVGVTVPLSVYTRKVGKDIKAAYIKPDGTEVYLSPLEVFPLVIGFAGEYTMVDGKPVPKDEYVKGYKDGEPGAFKASEIDVYLRGSYQLWSLGSSSVPFLNSNSGNRAAMAGRQATQAVQLVDAEAPIVNVMDPVSKKPWNELIGNALNIVPHADFTEGSVVNIDEDYITVKEDGGKTHKIGLYNNFPLNQESFLQSTPLVKVGDRITSQTVLAKNNFQDENLSLALGKNVNVAYMPWKGLNVEDATVVTETAANKLFVSESIQKETLTYDNKVLLDLNKFMSIFPDKIESANMSKYDADGIIKKGVKVAFGDYIIVAARERELTQDNIALGKINKLLAKPYADIGIKWESEEEGEVIYVNKGSKRIDVHIKMKSPLQVGDKLAGGWGNKMVVSKIIPDSEAPHTAGGERADLIMHPFGVIGRTNIGQLLATAAGKIARKTGKPYSVTNFENDSNIDRVMQDLKDHKIDPNEEMTDGKDGAPFERKIFFGPQYIMKLKHMVDHKIKTRSSGSYDINEQVVKGEKGGQSIDPLQWYALAANGLKQNLAETTKYLNVKNDEFWRAIQLGLPIPRPNRNFVWDKFEAHLKGSGISLRRDGNLIKMLPMTDKETLAMSGGEISDPKMVMGKNLSEIKGGLFDPKITGGLSGNKYAHMSLAQKIPNPVFEDTIQKLMGLTKQKYATELSKGTLFQDVDNFLSSMDMKEKLKELRVKLLTAKGADISKINYQVRVLQNLIELDIHPKDAFMMKYLPVIPPKFRPMYPLPNGDLNASPVNYHYKDVGLINSKLKEATEAGIESKDVLEARVKLYQAVKAAQGLGDPITYDNNKEGLIKTLAGDDPSSGFIQGKMWRKRRDLSGRSVATVNPELGIDELGVPNQMLWDMYKPFIIRELIKMGATPASAAKSYKEKAKIADMALDQVIKGRPIFMNRAPALHKHSVMAFKVRRMNGSSIQANPLIFSGFNLDFDGDTVSIYPPVTTEAVEEAWNALPSRNPYKSGTKSVIHGHTWDYKVGLYYATKKGKKTGLSFSTIEQARLHKPALRYNDVFLLNGVEMTLGLYEANDPLPDEMKDYDRPLDAKTYEKLLQQMVENHPNSFVPAIDKWKDLGYQTAFKRGQTLSVTDMVFDQTFRNKVMKTAVTDIRKNPDNLLPIMEKADKDIETYQNSILSKSGNNAWDFLESKALSGSKGKNINQVLSMVGLVADLKGNPIKIPIGKSWAEGQDPFDYWSSLYGARKGSVDRSIRTADTGYLNKVLLNNTARVTITEEDCGTKAFIVEDKIEPIHLVGRVLAENLPGVGMVNDVVDQRMYNEIKQKHMLSVKVRSPLTCSAKDNGICQKCYGWTTFNKYPLIGENIGISDSQSITEPLTQDIMRTFHTAGKVGSVSASEGFDRADEILRLKQNPKGLGTLATVSGTVNLVVKNPAGGYNITVAGTQHYVPYGREVLVKKGDFVSIGDPLSDGVFRPQEIAAFKGIDAARKYMVSELRGTFTNPNSIASKSVETVVKGITDRVYISDSKDSNSFVKGDVVFENHMRRENADRALDGRDPIEFKPQLQSIDLLPLTSNDWGEMVGARHIKKVITQSAALGRTTNIHGTHPLPGYMYALEYGQSPYY